MRRSSIYNIIDNPARKSDCSFGASGGFTQAVRIGSGSANSHVLGEFTVEEDHHGKFTEFRLYLDGHLLKRGYYHHAEKTCQIGWVLDSDTMV